MLCLPAAGSALILRAVEPGSTERLRAAIDYDGVDATDVERFNLTIQRVDPRSGRIVDQEILRGLDCRAESGDFVVDRLLTSQLARVDQPGRLVDRSRRWPAATATRRTGSFRRRPVPTAMNCPTTTSWGRAPAGQASLRSIPWRTRPRVPAAARPRGGQRPGRRAGGSNVLPAARRDTDRRPSRGLAFGGGGCDGPARARPPKHQCNDLIFRGSRRILVKPWARGGWPAERWPACCAGRTAVTVRLRATMPSNSSVRCRPRSN